MPGLHDHLVRARLARTDDETLRALIDAWRVRRLPEIARLAERAATRAVATRPARPPTRRVAEAQGLWITTAEREDPVELGALLADMLVPQIGDFSRDRAVWISECEPDPRIGPALLALAEHPQMTSVRPFWTAVFRALLRNADERLLPVIERLVERRGRTEFDAYLVNKLRILAGRIQALPPPAPPSDAEAALLALLARKLETRSDDPVQKSAEDFQREILEAPNDDGPREVYADWLQQRGEPRGELITLQLTRRRRGGLDPAGLRRERALLAEHARAWMGPLEPAVHRTAFRFERGFLHACTVVWRTLATSEALMTHPAWVTVREYTLEPAGERPCDRWLDHMIALGAKRV